MKKTVLFLSLLMCINLHAYYYYIPCDAGVASATNISKSNISNAFEMVITQVEKVGEAYAENTDTLKKTNELLDINKELKMRYLLLLKKINLQQQEIIKIKSVN